MKQILATTSLEEAQAVCALLRSRGVSASIENERSAFSAVGFPTSAVPLLVTVPTEEGPRASAILEEHRSKGGVWPLETQSPEEEKGFQEVVERGRRRRRWLWAVASFTPGVLTIACVFLWGQWQMGLMLTVGALIIVGLPFLMLLARPRRRREQGNAR